MPGALLLQIIDLKRKLNLKSGNLHTEEVATVNTEAATVGSCCIFKIRQTIHGFLLS